MFEFLGYQIIIFLIKNLPTSYSYFIGRRIMGILFLFNKKDQQTIKNNIEKAGIIPTPDLIKQTFYNFTYYLIDFLACSKINEKNIDQFIISQGENYINEALRLNKGVIILSAHIGNWELGGIYLGLKGYKFNAVAFPHKTQRVNKIFDSRRESHKIKLLYLKKAAQGCLTALKNNELVALIADRLFNQEEKPIIVNFMNSKIKVPRGPALLSIKTGAPLIPTFQIKTNKNKFPLFIEKPIIPKKFNKNTLENDIIELAQKYMNVVEKYIKQYPTQWFAFQDIFS